MVRSQVVLRSSIQGAEPLPLLLTRSLPARSSQPRGKGVGCCEPLCDFQGEGRHMLVNNHNNNHNLLGRVPPPTSVLPLTVWLLGSGGQQGGALHVLRGATTTQQVPGRRGRIVSGSPAWGPSGRLPRLRPARGCRLSQSGGKRRRHDSCCSAGPRPPEVFPARSASAMKPHVTYHQLKVLRSPEEPPLTQQPSLAPKKGFRCILVVSILSTMLATALLFHMFILPFRGLTSAGKEAAAGPYLGNRCNDPCRSVLAESVPEGLTYDDNSTLNPSIFDAWKTLLADATRSVDIASFYWTLSNKDTGTQDPSASQGEEILAVLREVPSRGVTLRIAVNPPSSRMPCSDLQLLEESGAQIRKVNFPELTGGVLHTKFWIVDQQHIFLGSANMDWRALTQSAPPALCAAGRTEDLQSLVSIIDDADEFVHIEVMSYLPTMEFSHPKRFWPVIDDHLRKVAYERRVRVRLLVGCWRHSKANMFPFLRSLAAMHDVRTHYNMEVRLFVVPANESQAKIPYARVNHSKFMVTDKVAYIGTSNWSGDYFLHTAGSALVVNQSHVEAGEQPTVRDQLQAVFERDWNSRYSQELSLPGQWEQLCGTY
ncbi:5'-3' exonuclease PLD3 isoform X2 [Podarcis raffonei]|uniref:5'-3' exonuclease PLD3 isoform X2 n=1 Tax=Podarcis raffonei TaxID=65483 RepID=UPI0023293B6D|nr:5'-3' exonuclease PLD3 isoform X2 [Podarcis raffonei]